MKKVIAGLLCTIMALAACGCGSADSGSKADTSAAAAESAAESTAESAAESEDDSPYTLNGDFSKGENTV